METAKGASYASIGQLREPTGVMQGKDKPAMTVKLTIRQHHSGPLSVSLSPGDSLFMLGANGSGKSNLMHQFYVEHQASAHRISAHRQIWMESGRPDLTPRSKQQTLLDIASLDVRPQSRWRDFLGSARSSAFIYTLMQRQNILNAKIVGAFRAGDEEHAKMLAGNEPDPLLVLSDILKQANIPIDISTQDDEVLASKRGGAPYSIAELSDGERNVVLLAAEVLTVPPGTLVLIDEPERHLHRSIIVPLLSGLLSKRSDCTFVISTHEVMLPAGSPASRILLVRGCTYEGGSPVSWDVDPIDSDVDIDEEIKNDILGARREIIFVEGQEGSLDLALYSLLFPGVSVVAKGSCKTVESAVRGIRDSGNYNWLKAFGIIDGDGRTAEDKKALNACGVYPIDHCSVESIYYDLKIQKKVAERLCEVSGEDSQARLQQAMECALAAATAASGHLAERAAERRMREEFMKYIPGRKKGSLEKQVSIKLDGPAILRQERESLSRAIEERDLATVIQRYPIRESGALSQIAKALGFQDQQAYENSVLKLLQDDEDMLKYVRGLLGGLPENISESE